MAGRRPDKDVSFSARHSRALFPTLNASSALRRIDDLEVDLERLQTAHDGCAAVQNPRNSGFEACSYYSVAYVTCLEWHARSRLRDFLSFFPDRIQKSDFEKLSSEAIRQMSAANVTVADLVAAATRISTREQYIEVFERILPALNSSVGSRQILRNAERTADLTLTAVYGTEVRDYCSFYSLYEFRNNLVHEIDIGKVGGYTLRDRWSFDQARAYGVMTKDLIQGIEKEISKGAPSEFPNLLDEQLRAIDPDDLVRDETKEIEQELSEYFEKMTAETLDRWIQSLKSYRQYHSDELALLQDHQALHPTRYFKPGTWLAQRLAILRLEYLRLLRQEVDPHPSRLPNQSGGSQT